MTDKVGFGKYLRGILTVGDFIILNVAYWIIVAFSMPASPLLNKWVWLLYTLSFIPPAILFSSIHNARMLMADRVVGSALKSVAGQFCIWITLLYVFDIFSLPIRYCIECSALFFLLLSVWWIVSRITLKKIRRGGFNYKRAIIIGSGKTAEMVYSELKSDAGYGYRLMGFFDNDVQRLSSLKGSHHGTIDEVADFVRLNRIDTIYYTIDAEDVDLILKMMRIADEVSANFFYVPKFRRILRGQFSLSSVGNIPAMKHSLSPLQKTRNRVLKRAFDLAFSIPVLILSPLVFIPVAIAIKLDSKGPVFFKQKRTGIFGRDFICYKFRTMKVNDQSDTVQATENDPRKTRIGDFLRKTSIDELPQFFNVLLGNMSVVGPRPHMTSQTVEYSRLIDKYMVRHAVKPGITGWAQVSGYRGGTKHLWQMEKRVEYDVWYIRNWNFFLDVKIIFLTLLNGFRGENAY